jgi:hypothetical protein
MASPCPKCQSKKTAPIKATQRLALCAETVNLLILSRLHACYPAILKSSAYLTLEKLSKNFVETLARSVQLKLRNIQDGDPHTHVCLGCGYMFYLITEPAQRPNNQNQSNPAQGN